MANGQAAQLDLQPYDGPQQQPAQKPPVSATANGGAPGALDLQPYAPPPMEQAPGSEFEGSGLETAPLRVLKGAAKGLGSTGYGLASIVGEGAHALAPKIIPAMPPKPSILQTDPNGIAENAGYVGEQIGEAMVPGLGEEKAGMEAGKLLPALGEYGPKVGRTAYNAGAMGLVNKAQGGSFGTGAALGGVGSVAGELGRSAAPSIAESALGVTKPMRGYGKTPGVAALEEVRGVRPATLAVNAETKIGDLTAQLEHAAGSSQTPASTKPALKVLTDLANKAKAKNDLATFNRINEVRKQLTTNTFTGQPIPLQVQARKLLDLKRGIGGLVGSWNPEVKKGMTPVTRAVYHALDSELDRVVPGSDELNQRISSLIPVAQRARSSEDAAEMPQRMAHRMAAHTGALASSAIGGGIGYERGGAPGAVMGSVAGLAVPEILSSAPVQMAAARALRSPVTARLARAGASQLLPRKPLEDDEEEK